MASFDIFASMEYEEILQEIISIAGDHFSAEPGEIGPGTTAADIPQWNSLSHVMLMARIEKEFGVKFELQDMINMERIEDMAGATHRMLS